MKYTPTNSELMTPESPHFNQDWWKVCEITPPDPWAYIVSDFQWSIEFLVYAQTRIAESETVKIGHYPESRKPSDRLKNALNTALQLQEDIEGMISVKCADLEFSWKWGEHQKYMAIIYATIPRLDNQKQMTRSSKKNAGTKFKARQWYALWLEDYKEKRKGMKVSREMFNPVFAKILSEIRDGQRHIAPEYQDDVIDLVKALLSKENDEQDRPRLTRHFTEIFWADKYDLALNEANKNKLSMPPYGTEDYEPIK